MTCSSASHSFPFVPPVPFLPSFCMPSSGLAQTLLRSPRHGGMHLRFPDQHSPIRVDCVHLWFNRICFAFSALFRGWSQIGGGWKSSCKHWLLFTFTSIKHSNTDHFPQISTPIFEIIGIFHNFHSFHIKKEKQNQPSNPQPPYPYEQTSPQQHPKPGTPPWRWLVRMCWQLISVAGHRLPMRES